MRNKPTDSIMKMTGVKPPWIEYPFFPPYDTFWRQTGEFYLKDIWEPFWKNLTTKEQTEYLAIWPVPEEWQNFYFDTKWLNSCDDI